MRLRLLALALIAGGCTQSGTGVMLTVDGPGLSPDLLALIASYGTRVVPRTIQLPLGLPTTVLAELPDESTTVTFDVTAKSGNAILAHGKTAEITVTAHHIANAMITLGDNGGGGGDGGDAGDGGGNLTPWTPKQGGEPLVMGTITGLWGPTGGDVYATSTVAGGINLYRSTDHGATWQGQLAGGAVDLRAVSGTASDVLLVGANSTIVRGSGTTWVPETAPISAGTKLFGVFVNGNGNAYACGGGNSVLRYNGGWILQTTVGTTELHAVWGVPGHVWVVGAGGTILHSTENNTWSPQTSNTGLSLNSVWGTSAMDVWAVGDGVVLHSANLGVTWSPMMSGIPAGTALSAVTAEPGGSLFVAGTGWGIYRLAGGIFIAEPTGLPVIDPTQDRLFALFAPSMSEAFAGGAGRTLLHRP